MPSSRRMNDSVPATSPRFPAAHGRGWHGSTPFSVGCIPVADQRCHAAHQRALFFAGLASSSRTLVLLLPAPVGYSLPPLLVVTAAVFMHNLMNTPAYATLAVFDVNTCFTWFWVRGWQGGSA